MKKILLCITLLAQFFLLTETIWADGIYFPDHAFRKLPEIPSQRAILSYKDGIETLIIESSLHAEGQRFGWIIPLPAEPIEMKKVPTELLNVFSNNTEPEIIHDSEKSVLITLFIVLTLFFMAYIFLKIQLLNLCAISLFLLLMTALVSPRMMSHSLSDKLDRVEGVDVRKRIDIGSYEVSVLNAVRPDDLNAWLEKNDFAKIPPAGTSIVKDYIQQHWTFIVAKLKRQEGGLSIPHPLFLKFPISKPVYPMRLTALSGANVFLRLFVVGKQRATLNGYGETPTVEFIDRYSLFDKKTDESQYDVFKGNKFDQFLSHPDTKEILWPECVVTSYVGTVSPVNMAEDYTVDFSGYKPFRRQYYSNQGAFTKAFYYMLFVWGLSLIIASLIVKRKGRLYVFTCIILPSLCICILGMGLIYLILPKIKVNIVSGFMSSSSLSTAKTRMEFLATALDSFEQDTGEYPTTAQGLNALISNPGVKGWDGPYLKKGIPIDPWNNPYHYISPAQHSHDIRGYDYIYKYKGYDLKPLIINNFRVEQSDIDLAEKRLPKIENALEKYKKDTGEYPTTEQGLKALVLNPGAKGWNGPYIEGKHIEGLSGPHNYESPDTVFQYRGYTDYDLYSYGEDNAPGGEGESKDITNWQ